MMIEGFQDFVLPKSWAWCKIQEIGKVINGDRGKNYPSRKHYVIEGIPFLSAGNLDNGKILFNSLNYIRQEHFDLLKNGKLLEGDILYCLRGTLGKSAIFKNLDNGAIASSLAIVRLNRQVDLYYIFYYLNSTFGKILIRHFDNGTAQPNLSGASLSKYLVPLPPLPIQRAIVAKIESLFSSLDSGIADLQKAQAQLKIYRQAVLKKAFEGELTAAWRAQQEDLPTAEELLEEIRVERERHYGQELADWKEAVKGWEENGKEGKKPGKPRKLKDQVQLTDEEISELVSLPNNWQWQKFGNVCLKIMDGTHFSPKNSPNGDYMYITAKNIKEGKISLENISFVNENDHKEIYSRCDVKKGDVLYIKDGATTGRAAVNNLPTEFSLLSSVGVFRTTHKFILPQYLEYYLNAQVTRNRMLSKTAGVAITRLTLVKLSNAILALCSPKEQHQIVREIESRLSVCDKVAESITQNLEKAKALRQSILKKAFEGKLLTEVEIAKCKQEADYEPAGVLLERIKAEKKKQK